jgi:hypothetical protein
VEDIEAAGPIISGKDVRGGITLGMTDVEAGAGGVGEHIEDIELWGQFGGSGPFSGQLMPLSEGMLFWDEVSWVKGPKDFQLVPDLLPLRFHNVKWILPSSG